MCVRADPLQTHLGGLQVGPLVRLQLLLLLMLVLRGWGSVEIELDEGRVARSLVQGAAAAGKASGRGMGVAAAAAVGAVARHEGGAQVQGREARDGAERLQVAREVVVGDVAQGQDRNPQRAGVHNGGALVQDLRHHAGSCRARLAQA
jgi:hypothetical protein